MIGEKISDFTNRIHHLATKKLATHPLSNPYEELATDCIRRLSSWSLEQRLQLEAAREGMMKIFSYAIPNDRAIRAIADLDQPVVEIGAGSGYWARLLANAGVAVRAFDSFEYDRHWFDRSRAWFPVEQGVPEVLPEIPADHALLLCWPPMSSMAARAARLYRGDVLIYVGEGSGGCCADPVFHRMLKKEWDELDLVAIPCWPHVHDYLTIYLRRA